MFPQSVSLSLEHSPPQAQRRRRRSRARARRAARRPARPRPAATARPARTASTGPAAPAARLPAPLPPAYRPAAQTSAAVTRGPPHTPLTALLRSRTRTVIFQPKGTPVESIIKGILAPLDSDIADTTVGVRSPDRYWRSGTVPAVVSPVRMRREPVHSQRPSQSSRRDRRPTSPQSRPATVSEE